MPGLPLAITKFLILDVGLSVGTATAITNLAVNIAVTTALTTTLAALTRPPSQEIGKSTIKQERPIRNYAFGRCRVSGPFMLREAQRLVLTRVIALPEGPVDHYGRYWLNDDEVTVIANEVQSLPDQRYPTGKVQFETRLGEDTETAYAQAIADHPTLWSSTSRGDGMPSFMLRTTNGDKDKFTRDFPNGEPDPSIEAFYRAYDWRDPGQDIDDNTTWTFSANPVVGLVNTLWRRYGADWDTRFAPTLDLLTAEADVCDERVDLKAGGDEARYECGFFFQATNTASEVMSIFLQSMDGWFGMRRDGAYVIRAGHYVAPTITFGDKEIWDYEFIPGPTPDAARNVLAVSFTDPNNSFSKVETDSWRDEDDILSRGEEKRDDFFPQAVQSNGQARRLAKRALSKTLGATGSFRTPLSARRGLGERFVGLNISECDDLNGVVVELGEPAIELSSASILWTYSLADPNLDAWNPETEEGDGPESVERPTQYPLETPSIDTISPFFESAGTGGDGVRLSVNVTGPDRSDLIWYIRWRVDGATAWVEASASDIDPDVAVVLETGFVTAGETIEVEVAYRTGSGALSDWSSIETADTSLDTVAPAAPTMLTGSGSVGSATIGWRNSTSTNFVSSRVYRGTTTVFGSAVAIGSDIPGAPGDPGQSYVNSGLSAGSYYFWIVSKNAAGTPSAPLGPTSALVVT